MSQNPNNNFIIKSYELIGKEENLGKISEIINKNDKFIVRKNLEVILIPKKSYKYIIDLSSLKLEESLCFSFNKNKEEDISKGDSNDVYLSHQQQNSNINKMIFDNEDNKKKVTINEEVNVYEIDNETDTLKKKKETLKIKKVNDGKISENILKEITKHKYIASHYNNIIILWEILYCVLILLGLNIFIHITVIIFKFEVINSFYVLYCGILITFLFYIGIKSLFKIIKDREKEICNDLTNEFLIFTDLITLCAWFIIGKLELNIKIYIITQTYYNTLFIFGVLVETFIIILNFTMNEVYREYDLLMESIKE